MARIFRTMLPDGRGPRVGDGPDMLGVRVPADVKPDAAGRVAPGKGLSVAPAWYDLPVHRIPRRLKNKMPSGIGDPAGKNDRCVWYAGEGPFVNGPLAEGLQLRVTSLDHGVVEPADIILLEDFQQRLAATRDVWRPIDEDVDCPSRAQGRGL